MKGHVVTPPSIVDLMVEKLFTVRKPSPTDIVLDPGCGEGAFIHGTLRYCIRNGLKPPQILGIELNPAHLDLARATLQDQKSISLLQEDFLLKKPAPADFIIGNPPYVPITELDEAEKMEYRKRFSTATERFDLYMLFFEQALRTLKPGGVLCFITPEKFEFVHTARALRRLLGGLHVREILHIDEETFQGLVTYPTITLLVNEKPNPATRTKITFRDGKTRMVKLSDDGSSWINIINKESDPFESPFTLEDASIRISCGVATGADEIFVQKAQALHTGLQPFAHPTISGRQLGLLEDEKIRLSDVMLIPYDRNGKLLPESKLNDLMTYLKRPDIEEHLKGRNRAKTGNREWYRFHDNVPFQDILKTKILCKDITQSPHFWVDAEGSIVPRHTVYYIVPKPSVPIDRLLEYLNGQQATSWLRSNCQRAAGGFLRLQSGVLRLMPIPPDLLPQAGKNRSPAKASKQVRLDTELIRHHSRPLRHP
jgi:adenine-specific DNA-methyltransferase